MEELIPVVNELHDAFAELKLDIKLDLPQIAVIGSQSSGKSSVLESIIGADLLPRGSGIVTRCPIVVQLQQTAKGSEPYVEFLHKPGKRFTSFDEARHEMEHRTEEMTQGIKGHVTSTPISVKVYSPHVLTLTVVDLPGLVMNAVGDQPKDIDRQIADMVTNYVRPSNTIMLAVSPANADMATSASLRLAKQLDPDGERTLGVLTKLDLMDRGVDAREMLEGKHIHLRLGFIGCVNRSQADINEKKGVDAARKSEREFFANHPSYRDIADKQGTEYLAKTLNKLLLSHIQAHLPALKAHIEKLTASMRKQQEQLGMLDECAMDPSAQLLSLIKAFSDNINKSIEGEAIDGAKELVGGARIDYIFHECFYPYVMGIRASKDLSDEYIRITIRNRSGMQSTIFPSDQVFITLVKQQIRRLEDPSVKCVNFIYDELMKIVESAAAKVDRFPALRRRFIEISQQMMTEYRSPTLNHVRTSIQAESGYINMKHPQMVEAARRIMAGPQQQPQLGPDGRPLPQVDAKGRPLPPPPQGTAMTAKADSRASQMNDVPRNIQLGQNMSETETLQNNQIRDMVEAYFSITQRNVTDQVPKIITLLMITKMCESMYPRLIQELYKESLYSELLAENADVAAKRKATTSMMRCLKKANEALNRVRDI